MKTVPVGWKVTHVRSTVTPSSRGRWGTDVTLRSGRVIKFSGKLTHARAVQLTTEYLRGEAAVAGNKPCGCPGDLAPAVHLMECPNVRVTK